MRILLVNDDGLRADGILALARELKQEHEVILIAPKCERSGYSHTLTYYRAFAVKKVMLAEEPELEAYSVDASPADCTKFGLRHVLKDRLPDLVISGINNGMNTGIDISYSGTLGAATEASMFGFPAIAVSCFMHPGVRPDYEYAARYTAEWIRKFDFSELPAQTLLNINFPDNPAENRGVMRTTIGMLDYKEYYSLEQTLEDGTQEYHLRGTLTPSEEEGSDIYALQHGYISLTPMRFDRVDHEYSAKMTVPEITL